MSGFFRSSFGGFKPGMAADDLVIEDSIDDSETMLGAGQSSILPLQPAANVCAPAQRPPQPYTAPADRPPVSDNQHFSSLSKHTVAQKNRNLWRIATPVPRLRDGDVGPVHAHKTAGAGAGDATGVRPRTSANFSFDLGKSVGIENGKLGDGIHSRKSVNANSMPRGKSVLLPPIVTPRKIIVRTGYTRSKNDFDLTFEMDKAAALPTQILDSNTDINSRKLRTEDSLTAGDVDSAIESLRKKQASRAGTRPILKSTSAGRSLKSRLKEIRADDKTCSGTDDVRVSEEQDDSKDLECKLESDVTPTPIDINLAIELKTLVYGSAHVTPVDSWLEQGLVFSEVPGLHYGLTSKATITSAVVSCLQAFILQHLLFTNECTSSNNRLCPDHMQRTSAVTRALATILWAAGQQHQTAFIALKAGRRFFDSSSRFTADRLTEKIMMVKCCTFSDVVKCLTTNLKQFETSCGLLLIIYSAVLSRTVGCVRCDMDDGSGRSLLQHDGSCSQELLNLLLTGCAVSYVFNNNQQLPDGQLSLGINSRCLVGFLTINEYYRKVEVGSYLKTPRYPIWLIQLSNTRFGVVFCTRVVLICDWKAEKKFELFYYDGLQQWETIKLTIDNSNQSFYRQRTESTDEEAEPVSPVELCICTKWPHAEISWNGAPPVEVEMRNV